MTEPSSIVHMYPPEGTSMMPCCGLTHESIPDDDSITLDPSLVTCKPDQPKILTLEDQITALHAEFDVACRDTANDMGEDIVEGGGWIDLARAVVDMAGWEISLEAKARFLRSQGLSLEGELDLE